MKLWILDKSIHRMVANGRFGWDWSARECETHWAAIISIEASSGALRCHPWFDGVTRCEMPLPLVNLLRFAQIDKDQERDDADHPAITPANLGHRPLPMCRIEFSMMIYGAELFESPFREPRLRHFAPHCSVC